MRTERGLAPKHAPVSPGFGSSPRSHLTSHPAQQIMLQNQTRAGTQGNSVRPCQRHKPGTWRGPHRYRCYSSLLQMGFLLEFVCNSMQVTETEHFTSCVSPAPPSPAFKGTSYSNLNGIWWILWSLLYKNSRGKKGWYFKLNTQNHLWLYLFYCVIISCNTILSHANVYYCVCSEQDPKTHEEFFSMRRWNGFTN